MSAISESKHRHQATIDALFKPLQPVDAGDRKVLAEALKQLAQQKEASFIHVPKKYWDPLTTIQKGLVSPSDHEDNPHYQLQFLISLTAKITETSKALQQPLPPPQPKDECLIL
jgi:hypothetical protein